MSVPDIGKTKKMVEELETNILDSVNTMSAFSCAIMMLYSGGESGAPKDAVQEYLAFCDEFPIDVEIYSKGILPLANRIIHDVDDIFDNYSMLRYDEWVQCLNDLVEGLKDSKAEAEVILQIHMSFMRVLKKRGEEGTAVVKQLGDLEQRYEEKYKEIMATGKVKDNWAVGLAVLPRRSMFASSILQAAGDQEAEKAKLNLKEARLTEAAAILVKNSILSAYEDFVNLTLVKLVACLEVLIKDMLGIIQNPDQNRKYYFFMMKKEAIKMKENCERFYAVLPDMVTDFDAIPEPTKNDLVRQWLANEEKFIKKVLSPKLAKDLIKYINKNE